MIENAGIGAQGPFMGESQLTRYSGGCKILRVTMDFQAMDMNDFEGDLHQGRAGFGYKSLINVVLVNPITNFKLAFAQACMQPCSTDQLGFLGIEDSIDKILPKIE